MTQLILAMSSSLKKTQIKTKIALNKVRKSKQTKRVKRTLPLANKEQISLKKLLIQEDTLNNCQWAQKLQLSKVMKDMVDHWPNISKGKESPILKAADVPTNFLMEDQQPLLELLTCQCMWTHSPQTNSTLVINRLTGMELPKLTSDMSNLKVTIATWST